MTASRQAAAGSVQFRCSLGGTPMPFPHFWEHTVGSDHAPMGLRADWREQLARCREELGFRHVRFHGLLSDRMGTLICHENAAARKLRQPLRGRSRSSMPTTSLAG